MKKHLFALLLMIGCTPTHGQMCEYCGEWVYTGFEYANHITADCRDMARDFKNVSITIGENFFYRTNSENNMPKQIRDVNIVKVPVDEYENLPAILISKDNKIVQKLYMAAPDMIYIYLDGCRFYFNQEH